MSRLYAAIHGCYRNVSSESPVKLWTPSPERVRESNMKKYEAEVREKFPSLSSTRIHDWSVNDLDSFWSSIWDHCELRGEKGSKAFVNNEKDKCISTAKFFPEAKLSVVENFLSRSGTSEAIVSINETGNRRSRSWDDLRARVASIASALHQLGVKPGDRVAAWLPNSIEAVEVMLGAASIGAVFSSSSPDFGVNGVLDRFVKLYSITYINIQFSLYNLH